MKDNWNASGNKASKDMVPARKVADESGKEPSGDACTQVDKDWAQQQTMDGSGSNKR